MKRYHWSAYAVPIVIILVFWFPLLLTTGNITKILVATVIPALIGYIAASNRGKEPWFWFLWGFVSIPCLFIPLILAFRKNGSRQTQARQAQVPSQKNHKPVQKEENTTLSFKPPFGATGQIIGILILLVLFVRMCGIESTPTHFTPSTTPPSSPAVSAPKTLPPPIPQPSAPKLHHMNEGVAVDYVTYTITRVETFTRMGNNFLSKQTDGMFVKVYLKILNNAKETKELFTPRFVLIDDQGRKFERLSDDVFYIADGLNFGKALQPGLSTSGAIVFEIPTDIKGVALVVSGDWLSGTEVVIQIDRFTDIGADTTLERKVNAQIEESMSKCNLPFHCRSSCTQYMSIGQKNCPSGQVCCMDSQ